MDKFHMIALLLYQSAVSYTHLDVYKRQDITTLTERVIHDQRDVMRACHSGNRLEIGHVVFRVPDGLQVDRLGSPID